MAGAAAPPAFALRRMAGDDIAAALAMQRSSYPPHMHEPASAYERRRRLYPAGSLVAVDAATGAVVVGYAQCHPWPAARLHEPAHLDDGDLDAAVAEALAAPRVVLYVHEVCVREDWRGAGVGGALMRAVLAMEAPTAASRYTHASLVAVLGNGPRWARFGFEAVAELRGEYEATAADGSVLPALLMVKELSTSAAGDSGDAADVVAAAGSG